MVCPICEHAQDEGDACEECGWRWAPEPAAFDAEACEGLEVTRLPPPGDVPILPLARLDRGRGESPPAPEPTESISLSDEEAMTSRCPNCGLIGRSGGRCNACGVPLLVAS